MSRFGRRSLTVSKLPQGRVMAVLGMDQSKLRKATVAVFAFGGVLIGPPMTQLLADRNTPLPRDISPGLQITQENYLTPLGCPQRTWSIGEFLPGTCVGRYRINPRAAPEVGLESPQFIGRDSGRWRWSGFRQREWIRVADDALLVARPQGQAGEVMDIVVGRFGSGSAIRSPNADPTAYRTPPVGYVVAVAYRLGLAPATVGAILLAGFWLLRRRDTDPGSPARIDT